MIWQVWWAWIVGGVLIAAAEIVMPGYVFLGFAAGAVLTGVLLGTGLLETASLPLVLLVFAVLSLVAWLVFRRVFGLRGGQVKIWDRDINDNP